MSIKSIEESIIQRVMQLTGELDKRYKECNLAGHKGKTKLGFCPYCYRHTNERYNQLAKKIVETTEDLPMIYKAFKEKAKEYVGNIISAKRIHLESKDYFRGLKKLERELYFSNSTPVSSQSQSVS